ncbi:TrkH family potassium uptake protein [Pseudoprimorskyibacter insulae]|uniref:Trk system potassium uptake protein TrkH n=1 Tax=Pseudoprimorskyibacter insulae TaxID=1695997 RepID=A0A2R8AWZ6_9RHOB|nr:potassium transporter TrkG [Pseudoprimorskyibacter insulae]SPF80409.1 Trk system potassium uptake protein TrkH [Pseudoprimorskyibacter insulae]
MRHMLALPLFLLISGLVSVSMWVPATVALSLNEFHDARSFFYSGLAGLVATGLVAVAMAGQKHNRSALRQLLGLLGVFAGLPLLLAVPFYEAVQSTTYLNAYFEMVSSLTTTGATLYEAARLSAAEHLWRAQVGWMGGLLMWIAAAAILAPLTLGGFEVTASGEPGQSLASGAAHADYADPAKRVLRSTHALVPIYSGLTLALWIMLLMAGDPPLVAISHAMSVMSTSGISPIGGLTAAPSGMVGEAILFCFMFFALSRLTFSSDTGRMAQTRLRQDPEFRMGLAIVVGVPVLLFLRHFLASFEVGSEQDVLAGLRAFWGSVFTVLSFLSTTGFVSADWAEAQTWSGLSTPGVILMGLAVIGGGVATTAGGVKLLRVFALYLNGVREMEKMIHPSSMPRHGAISRRIRREGGFIAWVFFMMFAMTISGLTLALAFFGVGFEESILLSVASLTNTGPLIAAAADVSINISALPDAPKMVVALAMVLGRLEMLAIVVMLTPDLWRN